MPNPRTRDGGTGSRIKPAYIENRKWFSWGESAKYCGKVGTLNLSPTANLAGS